MEEYDVSYLEARGTAHVARFDRKGEALEDLEKAVSYLRKMGGRAVRRTIPEDALDAFCLENRMMGEQRYVLWLVLVEGSPSSVERAISQLDAMALPMRVLQE
jgi:hypothetical protein